MEEIRFSSDSAFAIHPHGQSGRGRPALPGLDSRPEDASCPFIKANGNGVDGDDDAFSRPNHIGWAKIEDSDIIANECEGVCITDGKARREDGKPEFGRHQMDDLGRMGMFAGNIRLAGDDGWPVTLAADSDEGHLVLKDFVLKRESFKVFKGKSRRQCR